jgi:hypothetical protein
MAESDGTDRRFETAIHLAAVAINPDEDRNGSPPA